MIRLEQLKQAQKIFEEFRQDMVTQRDKAGAIQAFEFCYELSWKAMKKALESLGQESASPKDTFRKAAKEKIIADPEVWFALQLKRNLVAHTYRRENVEFIIESFETFSKELKELIVKIEELGI